jgi:hypothetical protein
MESAFDGSTDDGPLVPVCPRCERRDEVTPTFEKPLAWECWRCELRFAEGMVYL